MSDIIQKFVSNLIEDQFPSIYRSDGPMFVAFVTEYYKWLEEKTVAKNANIPHMSFRVIAGNSTINVAGASIRRVFSNGQKVAIHTDDKDYLIFTVNTTNSNTQLTVTPTPEFTNLAANVANTTLTGNPLYHGRRLFEYKNIDETPSEFVLYFKEKYLKDIPFTTNTNIRELVKHSLDIYRSKGTERSTDLLFRLVFGTGANLYYPSQDLFRLSDGEWVVPTYLEVTLAHWNVNLIGKQIVGMRSGAKGYVESAVRRTVAGRLIDVLYISPIYGQFRTGEVIDTENRMLQRNRQITHVIGSLNGISIDVNGSGDGFSVGQVVNLNSLRGREGFGIVSNVVSLAGLVGFDLIDGGYGYSAYANVLVSERVLSLSNVNTTDSNSFFDAFDQIIQPMANIEFTGATGVQANLGGNVATTANSTFLIGTGTAFGSALDVGDDIGVYIDVGNVEIREVISITNSSYLQVNSAFSATNTETKYAKRIRIATNNFIRNYYSNGSLAGSGKVIAIQYSNVNSGEVMVSVTTGNMEPVSEYNANLAGNVALLPNTRIVIGETPTTNISGSVRVARWRDYLQGTSTTFDKDFIYPSSNLSGTISVNTTSANVTGTETTFTTNFLSGDYLTFYTNSTHYETRRINTVSNSTHIRLDSPFTVANATANYSKGFKKNFVAVWQNSTSFEIRTVNAIVNSTYLTLTNKFGFSNTASNVSPTVPSGTKFLIPNANLTGNVAVTAACTTVTATGADALTDSFIVGDSIAFWSNSTAYRIRVINSITNSTSLTLTRPPEFTNAAAVFSNVTSNAQIVYGKTLAFMTNSTAAVYARVNAVVNASYLTLQTTLQTNNSEMKFANATVATSLYYNTNTVTLNVTDYADRTATGNVIGVSTELIIGVSNVNGTFTKGETLNQLNSVGGSNTDFGNGQFTSYTAVTETTGVLRLSNTTGPIRVGYALVGATSNSSAVINTVAFNIGVIDVENTFRNIDQAFYYTTSGKSNGHITSISLGSGANFEVSNDLIYGTNVVVSNAYLRDFLDVPLSATAYLMEGDPDGNLTSNTIYNIVGVQIVEFGKIYALKNISPGSDYTQAPFVKIIDPWIASLRKRNENLFLSGATATFATGEIVRQVATGARGKVIEGSNSSFLRLELLYINKANAFVSTTNSTTIIVGDDSGTTANVLSSVTSSYQHMSNEFMGLNANVLASTYSSNGAATSLKVTGSGYGFVDGEQVTFSNGTSSGNAIALVSRQGKGTGYYRSTGGFLSEDKKLHDGHFYQNYSYVVESKLTLDKYEEMLRKVLHVSGTKYFAEFVHATTANSSTKISTRLTTSG